MEITKETIAADLDFLTQDKTKKLKDRLSLIIQLLPQQYSDLIEEAFIYKRVPKEYLLSSVLFAVSSSIGRTFFIKALGYKNYANCYFAIIGSRGDTKTEAKKIATAPINDYDNKNYREYLEQILDYPENNGTIIRKQTLIQNATIEAALKVHSHNPNSVGISLDEIHTLINKMINPNSRDGAEWRSFFLEGYTNGHIDIARKTTESFRICESYPTLIGGLQNEFIPFLFSKGNLESGFVDRLLFTTKITSNNHLKRGEINPEIIDRYSDSIKHILSYKKQSENEDEPLKQFQVFLSSEAEIRLFNYTQDLINRQSKAEPILREYLAKMQISIHKLSLLVSIMGRAPEALRDTMISAQNVELAIQLNEFYLSNFEVILKVMNNNNSLPTTEDIIKLAKENGASQKAVVEITGLHKGTISKKWNKS